MEQRFEVWLPLKQLCSARQVPWGQSCGTAGSTARELAPMPLQPPSVSMSMPLLTLRCELSYCGRKGCSTSATQIRTSALVARMKFWVGLTPVVIRSSEFMSRFSRRTTVILIASWVGGALDLAFAMAYATGAGASPVRVLRSIASGLMGAGESTLTPYASALLGLSIHFGLSFVAAAAIEAVLRRHPALGKTLATTSIAAGLSMFFFMQLVALPLSRHPAPFRFQLSAWSLDAVAHVLLFALPMVVLLRRHLRSPLAA